MESFFDVKKKCPDAWKKMIEGKRSGEYSGCGKVSYFKLVSFYSVILATCDRELSWSKIITKL